MDVLARITGPTAPVVSPAAVARAKPFVAELQIHFGT
jgi:hypothetical protein